MSGDKVPGRFAHGIRLKKKYGQHFLRDHRIVQQIVDATPLNNASVFEIGCGDGVLTKAILQKPIKRLWVFEIDHEWVDYVRTNCVDERLTVFEENILDIDADRFAEHAPWVLLANLPYQITFPILYLLHRNRQRVRDGVIMVQEEVAEKILKTSGRGYGFPSLFFQHFFEWRKLDKVPPSAFQPPPKVFSRLLYFKPRATIVPIVEEVEFWRFIKLAFHQPRRTLRNNLAQGHYPIDHIADDILNLRAQQMSMQDLVTVWEKIVSLSKPKL